MVELLLQAGAEPTPLANPHLPVLVRVDSFAGSTGELQKLSEAFTL